MKYIFVAKNGDYISDLVLSLQKNDDIKIIFAEELRLNKIKGSDKFYIPSDTVYPLVRQCIDIKRQKAIDVFRNKYEFRMEIANLFPAFTFAKISLSELENYSFNDDESYIVKPVVGFMGAGARVINKTSNLQKISIEIEDELKKFSNLYPNIFSNEIIIEQYVDGCDEYAVDMYYNEKGKPVILNIYCHPAAKRHEYLQMLYYTNKTIFERFYQQLISFFEDLNQVNHVISFPIHAEFKMNRSQKLIPIEFNTCRFGGMGLADLTYYAFGFNPIKAFFDDFSPDWDSLWAKYPEENFCWVLGYNAADLDINAYRPSHEKFRKLLPISSKLLAYKKLDYTKSPGFALAYLSCKEKKDLEDIVNIEFNDCFVQ